MQILVVDDEEAYCRLLGHALRRLGHEPTLAFHPHDALEEFREKEFDAVITDIDMPGMTGVELARAIRAEEESMPIAFCTGSAPEDECRREASRLGEVASKIWRTEDVMELLARLSYTGSAKA
jgi:two-component system capsular synthesis sensor histidine kinase RcsC